METGCDRAVPDNEHTGNEIKKFFDLSKQEREFLSKNSKLNFEKYYQWDKTAKKWEDYFDSIEIKPYEQTWGSPPKLHEPEKGVPDGLPASQYARWLITNVLGEPDKLNTYFESR